MIGSIFHSNYSPIGLDIGARSVKMLQFRGVGDKLAVAANGLYELPRAMPDDPAARQEVYAKAVGQLLDNAPFHGRRVVTAISSAEITFKNLRLPQMPPSERAEAVRWEAMDRLGLKPGEAHIEFIDAGEVSHGDDVRDELIIMAVPDTVLQNHMTMLTDLGLRPVAIETEPTALCRTFARLRRREDDQDQVRAVIDVGLVSSKVMILRGNRVVFYKPVQIGGQDLNQAVAKSLDLSLQDASAMRTKVARGGDETEQDNQLFGSTRRENVQRAVLEATRPIVAELANEAGLCLRYYSVTFRGARPASIGLVGGEAYDPQLASVIGEHLEIEAAPVAPLGGIDLTPSQVTIERRGTQSEWALVTGLALRSLPSAAERLRGAA